MISNSQLIGASLGGALQAGITSSAYQSAISSSMYDIDAALKLRNTQRTIFEEQSRQITETLGQKLTANDLQVLEAAARLKAATAETGTSGGTTALASVQPYVIGSRNRVNLIQEARNQKIDVARRNIMSRLEAKNRVAGAIADMPSASDINLSMLASTIQGASQGYSIGSNIDRTLTANYNTQVNDLSTYNVLTTDYNVATGYVNGTTWTTDE